MDSLKRSIILITALLLAVAQGAWAQVVVSSESELNTAVGTDDVTSIVLAADVLLSSYLDIDGKTLSINLHGHKLYRSISGDYSSTGHVIYVHNNAKLTLTNSEDKGSSIEGGKALNGGAMFIEPGSTVIASNVTFQGNSASEHGGAIWNAGSFTATGCTFTNNTANDVGGFYNAIADNTYCGTATFTNCTFSGNNSSVSGGALANATGGTTMTLNNCTITGNTAGTNGSAVWNGGTLTVIGGTITGNTCGNADKGGAVYQLYGTLNMSGNPVVKENTKNGVASNLYLAEGMKISVTGPFTTGAEIGLTPHPDNFYMTTGFVQNNPGTVPDNVFTSDVEGYRFSTFEGEVVSVQAAETMDVKYLSEDGTELTQTGCYKVSRLSDGPVVVLANGWYVVDEDRTFSHRITIVGKVYLILTDNHTLNAKSGVYVPSNSTFTVFGQSNGPEAGMLDADARALGTYAGIGGNEGNPSSGPINIHGGVVIGRGGPDIDKPVNGAAGIGSASSGICHPITITGGAVMGYGSKYGAGIGSGFSGICEGITIKGGAVLGFGDEGAGIGSGACGFLHPVSGSATFPNEFYSISIDGGDVAAWSGSGAGIGGGSSSKYGSSHDGLAGNIYIRGGTVTAMVFESLNNDSRYNQAIGHGMYVEEEMMGESFLYANAQVRATSDVNNSNPPLLPAGIRANVLTLYQPEGSGVLNNYKTVIIRPCDHPGVTEGGTCPYCGKTATSSSVSFEDASDNRTLINSHKGETVNAALNGRTLWKDGSWNTLCLPFDLESLTGTPLEGATIKALIGATFSNGVLTLTFGEAVTTLEAGKPYIVKWNAGTDITNPVFKGVTIKETTANVSVDGVTFGGSFNPVSLTANDKTTLFLGPDNQLYYPTSALDINAFRGYFKVIGINPNAVSSFVMDAGEKTVTEVLEIDE